MIYTGGNVLARGLNFIIQVTIWSNLFPPDAYGQIAYCYVFISFMAVILPLGLDAAFMNYYVRGGKKADYLKNTLFLILSLAAVFSLIAILFRHTLAPLVIRVDSGKLFILSLGILFFDIINNQGLLYLRAEGKALQSVILQNIEIVVRLVLLLVLVSAMAKDIQYILWANLASSGTIFLIFLFILLPRMKGAKLSKIILSELLIFGMPFLLSGIFDRTIELADRRLIGYFLGDEATGLYVASYTVAVLMRLLVLSFNAGWQPYFLNEIDKEGGRQKLETIFNRTGIIFVAVWFIASVWLPELVRIPLGQGRYILHPSYWEGMSVIPVIMGAYVMMGLYFLQLPDLYHQKKTALNALFIGIGAALNLILNIILIPRMGIMGAAIATAAAYAAMVFGLRLWRYVRMGQKHIQGKMFIIMGLSLIMFIIMQIIEIQTVVKILITFGYIGLVYAIQPVRIKDIIKR
jgi:O-antigen/teichoic acid export membrane protein